MAPGTVQVWGGGGVTRHSEAGTQGLSSHLSRDTRCSRLLLAPLHLLEQQWRPPGTSQKPRQSQLLPGHHTCPGRWTRSCPLSLCRTVVTVSWHLHMLGRSKVPEDS